MPLKIREIDGTEREATSRGDLVGFVAQPSTYSTPVQQP